MDIEIHSTPTLALIIVALFAVIYLWTMWQIVLWRREARSAAIRERIEEYTS